MKLKFSSLFLGLIGLTAPAWGAVEFSVGGTVTTEYFSRYVKLGGNGASNDLNGASNDLYVNSTTKDDLGKGKEFITSGDNSWVGFSLNNKTDTVNSYLALRYYKYQATRYIGHGDTKIAGGWTATGHVEWEEIGNSNYGPDSVGPNRTHYVSLTDGTLTYYIGRDKHFNKTTKGFKNSFAEYPSLAASSSDKISTSLSSDPASYATERILGQSNTDIRSDAAIVKYKIDKTQDVAVLYSANHTTSGAGESTQLPLRISNSDATRGILDDVNTGVGVFYNLKQTVAGNLIDLSVQAAAFQRGSTKGGASEEYSLVGGGLGYGFKSILFGFNLSKLTESYRVGGVRGFSGAGNLYFDVNFNYQLDGKQGITAAFAKQSHDKKKVANDPNFTRKWALGLENQIIDLGYAYDLGVFVAKAGFTQQNISFPAQTGKRTRATISVFRGQFVYNF